jgi:molybdenum cofactor biosynthesis enzyme MoaA
MKKIKISDLKKIHIELSSYCNLKCPFCARQTNPIPERMNKNLSEKAIDNLLTYELTQNINEIALCGNYGEPTLSPNIWYFIERIHTLNPICDIWISTNGVTHDEHWWREFGKFVNHKNVITSFCIDGLTDEANKYRSSNLKKVFHNMNIYMKNGGKAEWKITIFKHNEKEIEQIKRITKDMGIYLNLKYSWDYDDEYQKPSIEITEAKVIHNNKCSFLYDGNFYVSSLGEVLPCCYNISDFFKYSHLLLEDHTINEIIESSSFKVLMLYVNKNKECRIHCDEG